MRLKVHSWGGLGSQLFVLSLIYELKKLYPKKNILIIHHTSGSSRREFELESLLESNVALIQIDDYKVSENIENKQEDTLKKTARKILKFFLKISSISMSGEDKKKSIRIYPWTVEFRGHYSKRLVRAEFLQSCLVIFNSIPIKTQTKVPLLSVHYRIGDLLDLPQKSIVAPLTIVSIINQVVSEYDLDHAIIFSESIALVKQSLNSVEHLFASLEYSEASTFDVLRISVKAEYFIGTNSKVSIWIQKFRNHLALPSTVVDR